MENIKVVNKLGDDIKVAIERYNNGIRIVLSCEDMVEVGECKHGDVIKGGSGTEWIVCDVSAAGTTIVSKDTIKSMEFGTSNDWRESFVRDYLNEEYLDFIKTEFGEQNIVTNERTLLSLDGYEDYGKSLDFVSILSLDEYRRFHKFIGNCGEWNWLLTPYSTPSGVGSDCVGCVSGDGGVGCDGYGYASEVRPVLILKSSTLVKKA